jgi:ribosomal protein S18 acetylase RimI-like enzyme
MTVLRPAIDRDARAIACILVEAFADEFRIVFGRRLDQARETMAAQFGLRARAGVLRGREGPEGTFVALETQEIVGLVACTTVNTPQVSPFSLARALWHEIGLCGTMRALAALSLLSGKPEPDACYVEYLAVRPQWRRRGIGTTLLSRAEGYAHSQSKPRLTLEVSSCNQDALRLYRRLGFVPAREEQSPFTDRLLGMSHWLAMEKYLP